MKPATTQPLPLPVLTADADRTTTLADVDTDPDIMVPMLLGGLRSIIRFGDRPRPPDLARRIVKNFLEGAGR